MTASSAEILLAAQLEQAGIPFEREYRFHPTRKFRADFAVGKTLAWIGDVHSPAPAGIEPILVEVDGATWTLGRHNHPTSIAKEYERTAAAAILGFRMIRATTEQVEDGTCLRWIREALGMAA